MGHDYLEFEIPGDDGILVLVAGRIILFNIQDGFIMPAQGCYQAFILLNYFEVIAKVIFQSPEKRIGGIFLMPVFGPAVKPNGKRNRENNNADLNGNFFQSMG
ncbi:hypothetical protein OI18_03140 [Flavihumibacter solisilvae]|uniref:Uncharacterized protein n=1 Tax=Flavihumibacter solisilvae TaxID=1349421 RepID=A0A0C1L6X9_9BACT|nr:hypothetical protein OI18_03140 [Flavihumibacter solisilvae]